MPPKKGTKAKAAKGKKAAKDVVIEDATMEDAEPSVSNEDQAEVVAAPAISKGKGKAKQIVDPDTNMEDAEPQQPASPSEQDSTHPGSASSKPGLTLQERSAKLAALRQKMRDSSVANRRDLIEETNRAKMTARELARIEKQRQLAEVLREKVEAQETGEDLERKRNWNYSIEENDEWTKRMEKKARRSDFRFHDEGTTAHKKYKKDLDLLKPDLVAYNRQKEVALGLEEGTLVQANENGQLQLTAAASSSSAVAAIGPAAEALYRDANTLSYADSKPSEEAIDRVVNKLNNDLDKRGKWSRKRNNEDEGDVTYINERNKVFNKKISRFYDKYTTEIRASFERGTAV